jgi:acetylornithine deacetylase
MPKQYTPLEMMAKLISFPTVSTETNLPLVEFVADYLKSWGVDPHIIYNDAGDKANLYAHIGPMIEGGVILSGHTDVVPVTGQNWSSDPWTVTERDGKYFGRGTCDMKGFDAIALAAVPDMLAANLKRPIQIALSYDEEIGCEGVIPMIAELAEKMPRAATCIVGEPSLMKAVSGHKGGVGFLTEIEGFEIHSSLMHRGVSAILAAGTLLEWHNQQLAEAMAKTDPDCPFDPPFTTYHVGTITGGTAGNITAKNCAFVSDYRVLPTEDPDEIRTRYRAKVAEVEAKMQAVRPETRIKLTSKFGVPGLKPEKNGAAEVMVRQLTGDNSFNVVSYGTEAGHFQNAGFSTVICGPGNIEQAHQPDEFVSVAQFETGVKFMQNLIKHLS